MEIADRLSTLTGSQLSHARSLDFARFVSALHEADGAALFAAKYSQARWPRSVSTERTVADNMFKSRNTVMQLTAAVASDEREITNFHEEARRASVPPGWLRP